MPQEEFKMRKKHFSEVGFEPLIPCKRGRRSNSLGHCGLLKILPNICLLNYPISKRSQHIFGYVTFELGRVEVCHWNWRSALDITFIFQCKNLQRISDFRHEKCLNNIFRDFQLNKKLNGLIFWILSQVRDSFPKFFTFNAKSF